MTKVHIALSSVGLPLLCTLAIGLGLTVAGCEQNESPSEPDRPGGRFGDAYQVLTNEPPDAPDDPPAIYADTLFVQVSYSGGCEDHGFDLDMDTTQDTTYLWLHHNDGGDDCEAVIYDRYGFELPQDALERPTIVLLNPNGDEPFMLRWNANQSRSGR